MWKHVGVSIHKTYLGFKRYVKTYHSYFLVRFIGLESCSQKATIQEYLAIRKAVLADARLYSILTDVEKMAISLMKDDYDLEQYDNEYLRSAYHKYLDVFFNHQKIHGCFDKEMLGLLLEKIRKDNSASKDRIARDFGISTRTIQRIENGDVLPSIDYLYLFCSEFDWSIDELLKYVIL